MTKKNRGFSTIASGSIYLDYAAAAPLRPGVLNSMLPYFTDLYANPSSIHAPGQLSHNALEHARHSIRELLHARPDDRLIFTGNGTESVNLALKGVIFSGLNPLSHSPGSPIKPRHSTSILPHIITSSIEHKSTLATLQHLQACKLIELSLIPPHPHGRLSVSDILSKIKRNTILVSLHYVNNELGTLQPVSSLGSALKNRNILFHIDACQAPCYFPLHIPSLHCDLLSLNSSKIGGPKGVGLLYARSSLHLTPQITGGSQQHSLRAGTPNVPGIIGFATALTQTSSQRLREHARLTKLRLSFWHSLSQRIDSIICNTPLSHSSPHLLSLSFADIEAESLVRHLSDEGIYCSTGSACTSHEIVPSHIITSLNLSPRYIKGTVRFSLGWTTTALNLDRAARKISRTVSTLRRIKN